MQQSNLLRLCAERVFRINKNGLQKEHPNKPKIGIAHYGQKKRPVLPHQPDLNQQISHKVDAKLFVWRGRWNFANAKAGDQAATGESQQQTKRIDFMTVKAFGHQSGGHRTADDGQKSQEFQNAIAPGKPLLRQDLRQQAVF